MDKRVFDKELEANVISAMIMERDCFDRAVERGVQPDDFRWHTYSNAYKAMLDTIKMIL